MSDGNHRNQTAGAGSVGSLSPSITNLTSMLDQAERATRRALAAAKAVSLLSFVTGVALFVLAGDRALGPSAARRASRDLSVRTVEG